MTAASDALAARVIAGLVDASARAVMLAALAGAGLALWRTRSRGTRSLVWTVVLYAALAMPVLGWALPALPVAVPTHRMLAPTNAAISPTSGSPAPGQWLDAVLAFVATGSPGQTLAASPIRWFALALLGYGLVVLALLGWLAAGWVGTIRLCRRGEAITDPDLLARAAAHGARLDLAVVPRLLELVDLDVPVTVGLYRPAVVLPIDWITWTAETREAVLAHELAHVKRRDPLTRLVAQFYRACCWMNPVAWWIERHLADLAEEACDDAALEGGIARTGYAETLLMFVARASAPRAAWYTAMARPAGRGTEQRIDRVLGWEGAGRRAPWSVRAAMTTALALTLLVVASLRVNARDLGLPADADGLGTPTVPAVSPTLSAPRVVPLAPIDRRADRAPASPADPSVTALTPQEPVESGFGAGAYRGAGLGMTNPVLVRQVDAHYTRPALDRHLTGNVELEAVVLADGTVGEIRVARSLDPVTGLNDEAVRAARQWVFRPATLNGYAVPMIVDLEVAFQLPAKELPAGQSGRYVPEPLADPFADGAFWSHATGIELPAVLSRVDPKYTADAMRHKIAGTVLIEAIVNADGSVGKVRVTESLDPVYGLDEQAVRAAQQWRFRPGTLNGDPVPVLVDFRLNFRLH